MKYVVKNTADFLRYIDSHSDCVFEGGDYPISDYIMKDYNKNIYYKDVYDGKELWISDLNDFSIDGLGLSHVYASPRHANVLTINQCHSFEIRGLKIGHQPETGSCASGVLALQDCKNVLINNLQLYGCGAIGLELRNCEFVIIKDSQISKCSSEIAQLINCQNITFINCEFSNNESSLLPIGHCKTITFAACQFENNKSAWRQNEALIKIFDSSYDVCAVKCTYLNNTSTMLGDKQLCQIE